jgi:hypothetical protein
MTEDGVLEPASRNAVADGTGSVTKVGRDQGIVAMLDHDALIAATDELLNSQPILAFSHPSLVSVQLAFAGEVFQSPAIGHIADLGEVSRPVVGVALQRASERCSMQNSMIHLFDNGFSDGERELVSAASGLVVVRPTREATVR